MDKRNIVSKHENGKTTIMMGDTGIRVVEIAKNRCAKNILESVELAYGTNSEQWLHVRKAILRNINDLYRLIEELTELG